MHSTRDKSTATNHSHSSGNNNNNTLGIESQTKQLHILIGKRACHSLANRALWKVEWRVVTCHLQNLNEMKWKYVGVRLCHRFDIAKWTKQMRNAIGDFLIHTIPSMKCIDAYCCVSIHSNGAHLLFDPLFDCLRCVDVEWNTRQCHTVTTHKRIQSKMRFAEKEKKGDTSATRYTYLQWQWQQPTDKQFIAFAYWHCSDFDIQRWISTIRMQIHTEYTRHNSWWNIDWTQTNDWTNLNDGKHTTVNERCRTTRNWFIQMQIMCNQPHQIDGLAALPFNSCVADNTSNSICFPHIFT